MLLRPATPLSLIFFVSFVLLLLSSLSTPIIHAISLCDYKGIQFGVFGYCQAETCSGFRIGYSLDGIYSTSSTDDNDFDFPLPTRSRLSSILVIHPIAAFFALVCFGLAVAAHFHGPSHSPRYLLALLILTIPTLLITLLAFLVDILLFVPHLSWGGWIVLVATVLIIASSVVTCAMRRTLVSRKARKRRIAENTEMNGTAYDEEILQGRISVQPLSYLSNHSHLNDPNNANKSPTQFTTFEMMRQDASSHDKTNAPNDWQYPVSRSNEPVNARFGAPPAILDEANVLKPGAVFKTQHQHGDADNELNGDPTLRRNQHHVVGRPQLVTLGSSLSKISNNHEKVHRNARSNDPRGMEYRQITGFPIKTRWDTDLQNINDNSGNRNADLVSTERNSSRRGPIGNFSRPYGTSLLTPSLVLPPEYSNVINKKIVQSQAMSRYGSESISRHADLSDGDFDHSSDQDRKVPLIKQDFQFYKRQDRYHETDHLMNHEQEGYHRGLSEDNHSELQERTAHGDQEDSRELPTSTRSYMHAQPSLEQNGTVETDGHFATFHTAQFDKINDEPTSLPNAQNPVMAGNQSRRDFEQYYEDVDPRFITKTFNNATANGSLPVSLVPGQPRAQILTALDSAQAPDIPESIVKPNVGFSAPPKGSLPNYSSDERIAERARSPSAASEAFTSISQRGVNPQWRPAEPSCEEPFEHSPRSMDGRFYKADVVLNTNPDFALPGMARGRSDWRGRSRLGQNEDLSAAVSLTPNGRYPTDM